MIKNTEQHESKTKMVLVCGSRVEFIDWHGLKDKNQSVASTKAGNDSAM